MTGFFLLPSFPQSIKDALMQQFIALITQTLGLRIREQEKEVLKYKLLKRAKVLGLPSLEAYYQILSGYQSTLESTEWRNLVDILTVNESYFFRDRGQFSLLKHLVLPELIRAKQHLRSEEKTIHVWSAGCSTGEEAYSLAILLKELIPTQHWNIVVLGSDINEFALMQAKRGIYSNWSFRLVDPEIQTKYFRPHSQGWEIDSQIRKMVTFQLDNLVGESYSQDSYPVKEHKIRNLDLILCRNVFIYFDAASIALVLNRFHRALAPHGYLITGHTELHGQDLSQFQIKTFPESVLYQRKPPQAAVLPQLQPENTSPVSLLPSVKQPKHAQPENVVLDDVVALIRCKAYSEAIDKAKQAILQHPHCVQAYYLLAETYANSGEYQNAIHACQQALQLNPFVVEPIYLLAQISQEQGDLEEAKNLLRRVIYLTPNASYAYFELGCLYEQQGNLAKARRNWQSAIESLREVTPDTLADYRNRFTAAELKLMVEQKLAP